jgi:hypothetical protein
MAGLIPTNITRNQTNQFTLSPDDIALIKVIYVHFYMPKDRKDFYFQ